MNEIVKDAQLNSVTKKECLEAIEYLWTQGFVDEMTSGKRFYTEILLKKVANDYQIKLVSEQE